MFVLHSECFKCHPAEPQTPDSGSLNLPQFGIFMTACLKQTAMQAVSQLSLQKHTSGEDMTQLEIDF